MKDVKEAIKGTKRIVFQKGQQEIANDWARRIAKAKCPRAVWSHYNQSVLNTILDDFADKMRECTRNAAIKINPDIKSLLGTSKEQSN